MAIQRRDRPPLRFSWHFLSRVEEGAVAGLVSSAEIAQLLRRSDDRITTAHVTQWRKDYPPFDVVCKDALDKLNQDIANIAYKMALEGDANMVKYWLDRRSPAFMPKQKNSHEFSGEQLDDILRRRSIDESELIADGTLRPGKPVPMDDGDGYDEA